MKKLCVSLIYFLFITNCSIAQLKIFPNGNIGIDATNPVSRFSIGTNGSVTSKAYIYNSNTVADSRCLSIVQKVNSGSYCYGILGSIESGSGGYKLVGSYGSSYRGSTPTSSRTYGAFALAGNGISGYNYGLRAQLMGERNGAAIFAIIPGKDDVTINGMYAGYFRGNIITEDDAWADHWYLNSDIKLKKEIRNIEEGNVSKLQNLQAIKYKLKHPTEIPDYPLDISDTTTIEDLRADINEPKYIKDRIGLIAQDIQKIFPELVEEDSNGFLSVNYDGLIPILIEAIKEQQVQIESLKEEMITIKTYLGANKNMIQ